MAGRFVRSSKYRHVFGRPTRREQCYDNLRVTRNAWDTNLIKANPEYLAVNWESSGGGAFAVIPLNERGKLPDQIPLFRGHTAAVLDTDWSPFDDSLIASGSDDGKIFLWKVPEDFTFRKEAEEIEDVKPVSKLTGHSRKVGHVLFNSSAKNVLASSSGDYTVKLWDIEENSPKLTLKHADIVQSLSWNAPGSLLVTTSRDKKLRVWDVRQEKPAVEVPGHSGAKNSRAVWMGEHDRIATTGFSKMSDRQLGLWDVRAAREPLNGFELLDQISGVCMPFWDDGTQCLYLAGKGDGNIRYWEYMNDKFEYLAQYSSTDPQRGVAFIPKRGVNTHENEVMRAYKTVNDTHIEPISFIVPRKADSFQDDIYPPAIGLKPSVSAAEWFGGKEGLPPKFSLESLFANEAPKEVPSDYKPSPPLTTTVSNSSAAAASPASATPTPISRGPPPSLKENKDSIADMAAKYADKPGESSDEEGESGDEDGETSSFEEIAKPTPRGAVSGTSRAATSSSSERIQYPTPTTITTSTVTAAPKADATPLSSTSTTGATPLSSSAATPSTGTASGVAGAGVANLRGHLQEIKDMLAAQSKTISSQNDKIDALTKEVEELKAKASAGWR